MEFLIFFVLMVLLLEIIEYDKSFKHLLIIQFGLIVVSLNLSIIITDVSISYTTALMIGMMLYTVMRMIVVSRVNMETCHDPDDDL